MPAAYTHHRFGAQVLAALPEPLRCRIEPHRALYDLGLYGPDLFFYHEPLHSDPVQRVGYAMHDQSGGTVFRRFAALDDGSEESFAYTAGFLCHFALDSRCHGYVEQMTALGVSHTELETQLDRSFLVEDGFDPLTYDPAENIVYTASDAKVIARFFPQVNVQDILRALQQMRFYLRLLTGKASLKRKALAAGCRLIGAERSFGGMIMTDQPDPRCGEMLQRLQRLTAGAVRPACELIEAWPAVEDPLYEMTFNGRTPSPSVF